MVGCRLCAGRLTDPRMVPPYSVLELCGDTSQSGPFLYLMIVAAEIDQDKVSGSADFFPELAS